MTIITLTVLATLTLVYVIGKKTSSHKTIIKKVKSAERFHERLPNIPGPLYEDNMFNIIKKDRHHGMIKAHEMFGELFQLPTVNGPIVFVRGADELSKVFSGKEYGKNGATWNSIEGAIDVSNLV